jgi:hypothetical protein
MKLIATAVVVLLQTSTSFSSTCSDITNDSGLGQPRNQAGIGWCYAFTAAELVSHKLGYPISATDIAIGYNYRSEATVGIITKLQRLLRNPELPIQAGDVEEALTLNANFRTGFCREETIPSSQFQLFEPGNNLEAVARGISRMEERGDENNVSCDANTTAAHAIFPRLSEIEIYAYLRAHGLNPKAWYDLSEAACLDRKPLPPHVHAVKLSGNTLESRENLLNVVDKQLEEGNVIGIQYNPLPFVKLSWWEEPDRYFTAAMGAVYRAAGFAELPTHAVTIIGRRMNPLTKSCEYRIRDSDNFNCARGRKGVCNSDGSIWYERGDVIRHVHDIIYLEN